MIPQGKLHKINLLAACFIIAACSSTHNLPPSPNIYASTGHYPEDAIPATRRTTDVELLYVTDRTPIVEDGLLTGYSDGRSDSMSAGAASIRYGEELSWGDLVAYSQTANADFDIPVRISEITETDRFPETPAPFVVTDSGPKIEPAFAADYAQSRERLQSLLRAQLSKSDQKEIVLYIHGFNDDFESALFALNDVWHYTGRHGVPMIYSWPSGSGSLLGYFTDRESGEFTIFHLKETLRILSQTEEVERVHIIAHSRGTDITTTALRELVIETRASGLNPRDALRVENLILAAPDIDYGVVKQRLIAEQFGAAFGKITIYMNEDDSALGISQWLMKGVRFGRLKADEQGAREDHIFHNVRNVSFVSVTGVRGGAGHAYFRTHPGVLSDIARVIKTDSAPGAEGRPLVHMQSNFWRLDREYLSNPEMD